ncbi:MAG: hypothetical protein QFB87_02655 [Patescibacteria group bacterium]|nr:hypothetical protein [Patescibacteria group bacterium]
MSMQESYAFSSEDCRHERLKHIDLQERNTLDQLRSLQAERAALLQTLGVTALQTQPATIEASAVA